MYSPLNCRLLHTKHLAGRSQLPARRTVLHKNWPLSEDSTVIPLSINKSSSYKGFRKVAIAGFLSPNQSPAKIMFSFAILFSYSSSSITRNKGHIETFEYLKTGTPSKLKGNVISAAQYTFIYEIFVKFPVINVLDVGRFFFLSVKTML